MPAKAETKRTDYAREVWGVLTMAFGAFFALALISYTPTDPAFNSASNLDHIGNLCGVVGAYAADILLVLVGISAGVIPLLLFTMSLLFFFGKPIFLRLRDLLYGIGLVAFVAALIHLRFSTIGFGDHVVSGGGILGSFIGELFTRYFNRVGAYLLSTAGAFLFLSLTTRLTLRTMVMGLQRGTLWLGIGVTRGAKECWSGLASTATNIFLWGRERWSAWSQRQRAKKKEEPVRIERAPLKRKSDDIVKIAPLPREPATASAETGSEGGLARHSLGEGGPTILKRADVRKRQISDSQLKLHMRQEGYSPPPISLLDASEQQRVEIDENILRKNSMLLEKKLTDFEVAGRVTAIHPGPVITMYEFEPAPGTKVNKVTNLEDDLSLTLGGRSVRIIPHLPGKAALGIEVPNHERETVYIKDIIASTAFQKSSNKLPLAIGTNTEGHPVVADLSRMPHLLIAGATGSGKSVCINAMITSILYKLSPEEARMILVDPKMLELSVYDGIPHLLLPVVTKPKQAVSAMRWAVKEMERRYRIMADCGARHIAGYNEKIKKGEVKILEPLEQEEMLKHNPEAAIHTGSIPYIIIIIDELADLMMTASQEMEETITRIAQMARAAGIHLILATQRPSVDVVTGLIKANFPARISFKVSGRHDSRTILDSIGAEKLLGAGDMLLMSPSGGEILRHHGCLITDGEIARVVTHLKQQGEPVYDETILEQAEKDETAAAMGFDDIDDELYDQAVTIVTETRQASISMVQRRLRIGYNRAARLIERMEAEGVIGRAEGSKPREVLASAFQK